MWNGESLALGWRDDSDQSTRERLSVMTPEEELSTAESDERT